MKDKINVLFVCGYGLGSSTIAETLVKKNLDKLSINAVVNHTAVGEMQSQEKDTDIIVISTKLAEGIDFNKNVHVIKIVNIMDGPGIAREINKVVDEYYPAAKRD